MKQRKIIFVCSTRCNGRLSLSALCIRISPSLSFFCSLFLSLSLSLFLFSLTLLFSRKKTLARYTCLCCCIQHTWTKVVYEDGTLKNKNFVFSPTAGFQFLLLQLELNTWIQIHFIPEVGISWIGAWASCFEKLKQHFLCSTF